MCLITFILDHPFSVQLFSLSPLNNGPIVPFVRSSNRIKIVKDFFVKIFSEECQKAPARPKQRGLVILAVSFSFSVGFWKKRWEFALKFVYFFVYILLRLRVRVLLISALVLKLVNKNMWFWVEKWKNFLAILLAW